VVASNYRLSEATTAWLQKYNPHVVEITSYNRAKHIAESLVGVFENQWQEMYLSSRNKLIRKYTDREIVEKLRDILKVRQSYKMKRINSFMFYTQNVGRIFRMSVVPNTSHSSIICLSFP
jgi:hypothetical protein